MTHDTSDSKKDDVALDARKDIKDAFDKVEALTKQLSAVAIPSEAPHLAYRIAIRDSMETAPEISPEKLTGGEAWAESILAFARYYKMEGQHPMAVYRLPGLVYVQNIAEVAALVSQINQAKADLKALITSIPSGQRNRLVSSILPGVILLQVYRKIELIAAPVRRYVFSWVSTNASQKITVAGAIALVEKDMRSKAGTEGELFPGTQQAQLKGEIAMLASLDPRTNLRIYRAVSPHPRLIVFDRDEGMSPILSYHANLPLITTWEEGVTVRGLPNFSAYKAKPKQRKDTKAKTLLIPRLHIYALDEA